MRPDRIGVQSASGWGVGERGQPAARRTTPNGPQVAVLTTAALSGSVVTRASRPRGSGAFLKANCDRGLERNHVAAPALSAGVAAYMGAMMQVRSHAAAAPALSAGAAACALQPFRPARHRGPAYLSHVLGSVPGEFYEFKRAQQLGVLGQIVAARRWLVEHCKDKLAADVGRPNAMMLFVLIGLPARGRWPAGGGLASYLVRFMC